VKAAQRLGTLAGLSIGLVESALVLGGATDTFERWYEWLLMPFAGVALYSLGGALAGALLQRWLGARRGPWWLLFMAAAAWLVKCRWMTVQPARVAATAAIGAAAVALLALLMRPRAERVATVVARLLSTAAFVLLVGGALRVQRGDGVGADFAWGVGAAMAATVAAQRGGARRKELLGHALLAVAALRPAAALRSHLARPAVDRPVDPALHAPADAPDVVLVTWDTVRADTLPCFGGAGLDTPALDRLVREGALFTDCRAVAPSTAPAHLSLLTGLMPPRHGLRSNGESPPPLASPRLPELLASHGWRAGAFISTFVLRREYGFDRGFHRFDGRGARTPLENYVARFEFGSMLLRKFVPAKVRETGTHTPGDVTRARAEEWWRANAAPRLLWSHFYDAHAPYTPESPFRERTRARAGEGPRAVDPTQQENLVAQRGEIEQLDARLGELVAAVERGDPGLRRTWIVVVADHGECFGEGGHVGHHRVLYDATQQVALVIRPPTGATGLPTGIRIDAPCNQVDLLPTLCDALALPAPADLDGTSLLPGWRGEEFAARGFYMEAFQQELGERRLQGWSERGFDFVRALDGTRQLFAPDAPLPLDASAAHPDVSARLEARMDDWLAAHPPLLASEREMTAEEKRALEALGYAGGK